MMNRILSMFFKKKTKVQINDNYYECNGKLVIEGNNVQNNIIINGSIVGSCSSTQITVNVHGDCSNVSTTSGNVNVQGNASNISTTSGDVTTFDVHGSVSTTSGDVSGNTFNSNVKTVSGDISIRNL